MRHSVGRGPYIPTHDASGRACRNTGFQDNRLIVDPDIAEWQALTDPEIDPAMFVNALNADADSDIEYKKFLARAYNRTVQKKVIEVVVAPPPECVKFVVRQLLEPQTA